MSVTLLFTRRLFFIHFKDFFSFILMCFFLYDNLRVHLGKKPTQGDYESDGKSSLNNQLGLNEILEF